MDGKLVLLRQHYQHRAARTQLEDRTTRLREAEVSHSSWANGLPRKLQVLLPGAGLTFLRKMGFVWPP